MSINKNKIESSKTKKIFKEKKVVSDNKYKEEVENLAYHPNGSNENATQIYNICKAAGWSINAICGMLGNLSWESYLNPTQVQQGGYGYGLAQWDPNYFEEYVQQYGITQPNTIQGQMQIIIDQMNNGGGGQYICKNSEYWLPASEFITSTNSVEFLTLGWLYNYEQAGVLKAQQRIAGAEFWYSYFTKNQTDTGDNSNSDNTNNTPETSGGSPSISSNPPISTGIDYNSNGGINIGNQPTYNWNARVTASQIDILNLDGTSPGDYYTSAGDHITILDIDGDQQMALIQYPDQSAGIYQQGWISSSYISQDYMDQTFYSLWTNKVENQQIIFHDGTIAETSLTAGVEITFLYTVDYNDTTYACVAYIDDNGNPESGYVPWSSGSLNMIGADIPYYAKYGTEPVELTYLSNAITQASAIDIVDINGISIPNSYTSSGDNILILNVYMEEELVMIEYPDQVKNVHYTGFIPAESLVNGDVSINANTVTWNNSDGSYDMYGISTNDLLYTLPASQTVQFLYRTNDGYACLLFNNNTDNELLESGYTSLSNGSFGFN